MDGKKIHGRKQAVEFREELFKEHFGLSKEEQGDIVSDRFWKSVADTARKNTQVYKEIFYCYPDNEIGQTEDIRGFMERKPEDQKVLKEIYEKRIKEIRGNVVEYPLNFLSQESDLSGLEFFDIGLLLAPRKVFT